MCLNIYFQFLNYITCIKAKAIGAYKKLAHVQGHLGNYHVWVNSKLHMGGLLP